MPQSDGAGLSSDMRRLDMFLEKKKQNIIDPALKLSIQILTQDQWSGLGSFDHDYRYDMRLHLMFEKTLHVFRG